MAFLIQLFLPLYDNEGHVFTRDESARVRHELTERFGGVTAFTRAPATGIWEDETGCTHRDDVVIVEVMTETLDRAWWKEYGGELAMRFRQQAMVIRAMAFESLV